MRAHELVEAVRQAGGWFETHGDSLKVKSDRGPLPDDLVEELRSHKPEILTLLTPGTELLGAEKFQTDGPPKLDR